MSDEHAVWDLLVRIGHWSLALFFALAYYTGGDELALHGHAGYTVGLIVVFRLFWGMAGFDHARFSDFIQGPRPVLDYLGRLLRGETHHYSGHDPAGGVMIVLLLVSLMVTVLSGLVLFAMENRGPLAGTLVAAWPGGVVEAVHEFAGDFCLVLVAGHIAGVVVMSRLLRENLIGAMWHGRKRARHD